MKKFIPVFFLMILVLSSCDNEPKAEKITKSYAPRMTAPEHSNRFYFSGNIFYKSGFGMPNCTAYAWGRVYELLNKEPRLCVGNARDWYKYNKNNKIYLYGKKPELGAIACFNNKYGGHVAVVEKIKNNKITFSNSAYKGKEFYLSYAYADDKNPGQSDWTFLGYIYPLRE